MKKKIINFIAVIVIAVLAIGNSTVIVDSSSNDISLNNLITLNVAQAEDPTWGTYYIDLWDPVTFFCWPGGYFCCPGWGDCTL